MQTILDILDTLIPILLALSIGVACRKTQVLSQASVDGLRSLIGTFIMPVVILKAFYLIELDRPTLTMIATVLVIVICSMLLGYPLRRFFGHCGSTVPFLTTSYEGGMLGYALYGIIMGTENTHYFACADLGGTLFVFSIFLMAILAHNSGTVSIRETWHITRRNPAFWAVVLGLILGISGLGGVISGSPIGPLWEDSLNFLTQPVGMLILVVIGYNFRLDPRVNRLAVKMLLCRYGVQGVMALIAFPLLSALHALNPYTTAALALMLLLPPSFAVPIYLDTDEEQSSFLSILMSIGTVSGIVLFLLIDTLLL